MAWELLAYQLIDLIYMHYYITPSVYYYLSIYRCFDQAIIALVATQTDAQETVMTKQKLNRCPSCGGYMFLYKHLNDWFAGGLRCSAEYEMTHHRDFLNF